MAVATESRRRVSLPPALGDRRVLLAASASALVVLAALLTWLAWPRDYLTGTNNTVGRIVAGQAANGQRFCVLGQTLPAGTGRIRFVGGGLEATTPTSVDFDLTTPAGVQHGVYRGALAPVGTQGLIDLPVKPLAAEQPASICLTPHGGTLWLGGMAGVQRNEVAPTLDGTSQPNRIGTWFLPPAGERKSLLGLAPKMFERAALFRPGIVGAWTYWVLFLVALPALAISAVILFARAVAQRAPRIPRAGAIVLIAIASGGSFALITPMFQAPDESEHFAAVEYLATTGKAVDRNPGPKGTYSGEETLALEAVHHGGIIENSGGRPPWRAEQERAYEHQVATYPEPVLPDNGGGFAQATSSHSPLYYALASPAYLLGQHGSVATELTLTRLVSVLFGAITALMAFLTMRELLPNRPWTHVFAGLLVSFQPMFGFISGAVNNDNGVNAAAAAVAFLLIRALRRGLSWRLALGLGAALAVAPLLKGTAYFLYPVAALALLGVLIRGRHRKTLIALGTVVAAGLAVTIAWAVIAPVFGRTLVTAPSGNNATQGVLAFSDPYAYFAYVWQLFFPGLPGMQNIYAARVPFVSIYVVRGWGAFGWYAILFPGWMTVAIAIIITGGFGLVIRALWRFRDALKRRFSWEVLVLAAIPLCVFLGVEAFYASPVVRPGPVAEQGRYIFPAAVSLAAAATFAAFAFGRRLAPILATVFLVALVGLSLYSRVLELAGFYS
jgi:4-amino-4-deoxy-L-arabinose transferase-like glycosyltransferase